MKLKIDALWLEDPQLVERFNFPAVWRCVHGLPARPEGYWCGCTSAQFDRLSRQAVIIEQDWPDVGAFLEDFSRFGRFSATLNDEGYWKILFENSYD